MCLDIVCYLLFTWNETANVILMWENRVLLRPRGEKKKNTGIILKSKFGTKEKRNSAAVTTNGSLCIVYVKCEEKYSNLWKLHCDIY